MANSGREEYVSKYNYEATKDDELTLTKGMHVLVMEKEGDGWWFGRDADKPSSQPGWFPSNYVAKATTNAGSAGAARQECIQHVRALYTFNSGNAEELPIEADERLDIIEQPPDDPEWWLARNASGATGLVPKTYVEVIEDEPMTNYDAVCQMGNGSTSVSQITYARMVFARQKFTVL